MTTAPTKEDEFKQRFASVLRDLQQTGANDGEAMGLIGSLAFELAEKLQQGSWSGAKSVITPEVYNGLLKSFETQGNSLHQSGKTKQAYAIQALAMSLIAGTQRQDPQMVAGEKLLDAIIDRTVVLHREQHPNTPH